MYINFFLNVGPHKVGGPIQMFCKTTFKPGSAGRSCIIGMRPRDELVQAGTKKLVRFMVCCSDCTICQDVWKHANNLNRYGLEFRYVNEEWWKTDEIKELEL